MKRGHWIGLVFLTLSVAVALYLMLRPNVLRRSAQSLMESLFVGDIKGITYYMTEEERTCSNLDSKTLERARDVLIGTPMKRGIVLKKREAVQTSNTFQASCSYFMKDANGVPWQFTTIINDSDDGPKATVLVAMFYSSIRFNEDGTVDQDQSKVRRYAKMQDRIAKLKALGISKIFLSPGRCIPLDEFLFRHNRSDEPANSASGPDPKA